jgi:hypothetical protein
VSVLQPVSAAGLTRTGEASNSLILLTDLLTADVTTRIRLDQAVVRDPWKQASLVTTD